MSYPDHNTINRFRGARLKHALRSIFENVVELLAREGLLSIDETYTDGTKMEANANRYTFVWKKSIQANKEKMKKQLTEIWQYAQQIAADEDKMPEPPDFTEIDSQKVKQTVDQLNKTLAGKENVAKKVKAKLVYHQKLPGKYRQVRAAGSYPGRKEQLQQNRYGCHVHAHEGRSHEKRPVKAGL